MKRVVLAVELKGLVDGGPVDGGLDVPQDPEAVLEADDGALIEAEEIAGLLAEAAALEIAVEAVGQLKVGFPLRKPECRRQVDDAKIRLRQLQLALIVSRCGGGRLGGRGGLQRVAVPWATAKGE